MQHYYLKTATDELVFTDVELDADAAPQVIAGKNGTFRLKGVKTWGEASGQTLDGVTRLTKAEVGALTPAQQAVLLPFMQQRKAQMADALCLIAWDGTSPFVEVLVSNGHDPFAAVAMPVYDPQTHAQTGTEMRAPGIPFAGWPQTTSEPPPPAVPTPLLIDAANAAAAASEDARTQWRRDAALQMTTGIATVRTWLSTHPYPQ